MKSTKLITFLALVFSKCVMAQPEAINAMSFDQIKSELDYFLEQDFKHTTPNDIAFMVIRRLSRLVENDIAAAAVQSALSEESLLEIALQSTGSLGIALKGNVEAQSAMCIVWNSSSLQGSERIDAALLARERIIRSSYDDHIGNYVRTVLANIETNLDQPSWAQFEAYFNSEIDNFSGNLTKSFYSTTVRKSQDEKILNDLCNP